MSLFVNPLFSQKVQFDNTGVEKLRSLVASLGLDLLIISDAGAEVDWMPNARYSSSRAQTLYRCTEIWQYRINSQIAPTDNERLVSIHDTFDTVLYPGAIGVDEQRALGKFRTDFDRFSVFEFWCLYNHGYSIAEKTLKSVASGQAKPMHGHTPWQRDAIKVPANPSRALGKSSKRRLIPLNWKALFDPVAWLYVAILILLIFWGLPYFAQLTVDAVVWLAERNRDDYLAEHQKLPALPLKIGGNILPLSQRPYNPSAKDTLQRLCEGFASSLAPDQKLLVIEQDGVFDKNCRSFSGVLNFRSNAKAVDGKAYLVLGRFNAPAPGCREASLPKDNKGALTGRVSVDLPKKGEFLVLLLVVEPLNRAEKMDAFPGANAANYNFTLEVK